MYVVKTLKRTWEERERDEIFSCKMKKGGKSQRLCQLLTFRSIYIIY